jgi:hypothetical protein
MADYTGDFALTGGGTLTTGALGMTDLAQYTDSVRNIIARPGTFADLFPETTDDHLLAVLTDGLAECHLEGTLLDYIADADGLVRPQISSGQAALIVLYSGVRLIRAELLNRVTSAKYVAGPVSAETTYATNVLRDIMRVLEAQKTRITTDLLAGRGAGSAFLMADAYVAKSLGITPNGVGYSDWALAGR